MNQINEKQSIAILGSTGSIGTQTLDVIDRHPDKFTVEFLSANNNFSVLAEQIVKYKPNVAVIVDENCYDKLFELCKEFTKMLLANDMLHIIYKINP